MASVAADLVPHLERMLDALERTDLNAAMAEVEPVASPDVVFTSVVGGAVEGRRYEGLSGVREWFGDLTGSFDVAYRDREFRETPDGVVLLARLHLRGRSSEAELTQEIAIVARTDEAGLIRTADTFASHAAALERAGIA